MIFKFLPTIPTVNFISNKNFAYILSAILIIISIASVSIKGLNLGIDFTGGLLIEAEFEQAPKLAKLRQILTEADIKDISLQHVDNENQVIIRLGKNTEKEISGSIIAEQVKKLLEENIEGNIEYRKVEYVGPKVGSQLIKSGILALGLALIAILIYIWIRFEWQYGVGAVVALVHDVLITFGFFSVVGLDFNLTSIAAILTVIGYSINDTVVVFDRVRENLRKYKAMPLEELLNNSVNQTLSRTLLTSLTTILALLALVIFGGNVIKSFSSAALFGILIGTYSSIYIAAPTLIHVKLRKSED